jgi:16S rRNA (cytidine1402-2'-O)-methyltransferase
MKEHSLKPALLLLPNLIGDHSHHEVFLPNSVDKAVGTLDGLIAESAQAGRRYLARFSTKKAVHEIPIALYNKHTPDQDLDFLLEPIKKGERWGLVSDAGLPCIADPGSKLVFRARKTGILVQAFVGPSSLLLALMLSGLNGQHFSFHGYLDKEPTKLKRQLKEFEKRSNEEEATQIFMETPFRNQQTLQIILETLHQDTLLCAAWDLTLPSQGVVTQPIAAWKKMALPNLEDRNTLFLFQRNAVLALS